MTKGDERHNTATIFDVAKLAGVSIKTVSRVVNNEPNVSQKTREKVNVAVEQLQYRPNSAARGLSAKKSFAIGLVYENPEEFSYINAVINGAFSACEAENYSLLIKPTTVIDEEIAGDIRQFVAQAQLDGMILTAPIGDNAEVVAVLDSQRIPYASITPKNPPAESITIDCEDEQASFELATYLIEQGHRQIAFIKGHPDHWASGERFAGYERALMASGIELRPELIVQGYFDFASGRAAAASLLGLSDLPTVIVASNDAMASGVLYEAMERNIAVPRDLSVTGFDDTPMAAQMWPPLTTVRQPISQMADAAVRRLIASARGEDGQAMETRFKCELVIRSSCRAI